MAEWTSKSHLFRYVHLINGISIDLLIPPSMIIILIIIIVVILFCVVTFYRCTHALSLCGHLRHLAEVYCKILIGFDYYQLNFFCPLSMFIYRRFDDGKFLLYLCLDQNILFIGKLELYYSKKA